jgi:hypothetical protein
LSGYDGSDEPADAIIRPRSGENDCGYIDADAARTLNVQAGPIRLLNGYQGRKGWGYQHLVQVADRMAAIRSLNYPTAQAFVFDVSANWREVHQIREAGRLKLVLPRGGYDLSIIVEWRTVIWSVTTALPFRANPQRVVLFQKGE